MQGAAHTANAPPSKALDPRRRAPVSRPGREDPLGPRQQADEREPEHDEHEAGQLDLPGGGQHTADGSRSRSEDDEDDREPGDERQAPERHVASRSRLAEPIGLDRGHRRQVAGHERQDAGRDDRDHSREKRDRDFLEDGLTLVEARELLVHSSLERRAQRGRPARRITSTAPVPGKRGEHERPADEAHERQQPREQVEPLRRRRGQDLRPVLGDEVVLDLLLRVAGLDPQRNEVLDLPGSRQSSTGRASCCTPGTSPRPRDR